MSICSCSNACHSLFTTFFTLVIAKNNFADGGHFASSSFWLQFLDISCSCTERMGGQAYIEWTCRKLTWFPRRVQVYHKKVGVLQVLQVLQGQQEMLMAWTFQEHRHGRKGRTSSNSSSSSTTKSSCLFWELEMSFGLLFLYSLFDVYMFVAISLSWEEHCSGRRK